MLLLPVAAMQKVATVTSLWASLGKSVAPMTVIGGTGSPVRTMPGPPVRVWKQGIVVSLLQQPWLSPPLTSTHTMLLGFDGSGAMLLQASPVQLPAPQPADEQPSSATGTPFATFSVQGLDPPAPGVWSVPVVIGSGMVRVAIGLPIGRQSLESLKVLFDASELTTGTLPSTWQVCPILLPLSHVVKITSSGPPAAFGGQDASGTAPATQARVVVVVVPQCFFPAIFLQTKVNRSVSGPPDAALAVTLTVSFCPAFTVREPEAPQACAPLRSLGGTRSELSTVTPVSEGTVVHFFVGSLTHTCVSNVQTWPLHALLMTLFFLFELLTSASATSRPTQQSDALSTFLVSPGASRPGSTRAKVDGAVASTIPKIRRLAGRRRFMIPPWRAMSRQELRMAWQADRAGSG